jgi:hypothetical protein
VASLFTAGLRPTLSAWNELIRSVRHRALGSYPSAPVDGEHVAYISGTTRKVETYSTGSAAWVKDYDLGEWPSWSPTLTQSAAITVTRSENVQTRIGRRVSATCRFSCTSAGSALQAIQFPLPVNAAVGLNGPVGTWWFEDAGTGYYAGVVIANAADTAQLYCGGGTARTGPFGVDPAVTIASGDKLVVNLDYYGVAV